MANEFEIIPEHVIMEKVKGRPVVKVFPENKILPHEIVRHSPDGFEWGYEGSGPAELALNLLHYWYGKNIAEDHYQDFKRGFIVNISRGAGGYIYKDLVGHWLTEKGVDLGKETREIIERIVKQGTESKSEPGGSSIPS